MDKNMLRLILRYEHEQDGMNVLNRIFKDKKRGVVGG